MPIQSGYERHFEELKARLLDGGYAILAGEAGAWCSDAAFPASCWDQRRAAFDGLRLR